MDEDTGVIDELEERLARYPAERYPVQHATAQFHLGVALTNARDPHRGRDSLARAVDLFGRAGLQVERAKAQNALGATLRDLGDADAAGRAFAAAADLFAREQLPLDEGAARFNLGLVRRDAAQLRRARELLRESAVPAQAAAAARELGSVLLEQGDAKDAALALTDAMELAERVGDEASRGSAANALGLAHLASDHVGDAVDVLRIAVGANPRGIRPAEHAMAKANLALAYEAAGAVARARLAARQALGVHGAPEAVADQARRLLDRLGDDVGDLDVVLRDEPRDRWSAVVREELVRWADADDETLRREAREWIGAQDDDRAEALLGALLELPPDAFERVLAAVLSEQTRPQLERAAALFHAPQELRVREAIARLEDRWSSQPT